MLVVIMGVCGCGKTTIGKQLEMRLNSLEISTTFVEGDAYHPPANIQKMQLGIPLQDGDRIPWLQKLATKCNQELKIHKVVILACSALKQKYRVIIAEASKRTVFVHLIGSFDFIMKRVQARSDHFMPASLVQSQYDCLEDPALDDSSNYKVLQVSVEQSSDDIVNAIVSALSF